MVKGLCRKLKSWQIWNLIIKNSGKYFGKVLIKFNKDFQQGCVKYITVANRMEVIDTNYNFEER